jgi:hypothetical protein
MAQVENIEISRRDGDQITKAHLQRLGIEGWRIVGADAHLGRFVVFLERNVQDGR